MRFSTKLGLRQRPGLSDVAWSILVLVFWAVASQAWTELVMLRSEAGSAGIRRVRARDESFSALQKTRAASFVQVAEFRFKSFFLRMQATSIRACSFSCSPSPVNGQVKRKG